MAKRKEKGLIFGTSGKAIILVMFRNWICKILLIQSIPTEIFIFEKRDFREFTKNMGLITVDLFT